VFFRKQAIRRIRFVCGGLSLLLLVEMATGWSGLPIIHAALGPAILLVFLAGDFMRASHHDRQLALLIRTSDRVVEPHFYACRLHSRSLGLTMEFQPGEYRSLRDHFSHSEPGIVLPEIASQ
jgi:hypothetical protein